MRKVECNWMQSSNQLVSKLKTSIQLIDDPCPYNKKDVAAATATAAT